MKRIIQIIIILFTALSCSDKTLFTVNGTITENNNITNSKVIIIDIKTFHKDTVPVRNGKFTYKGVADKTTILKMRYATGEVNHYANRCTFIPEAGTVTVNLDSVNLIIGSAINDRLVDYDKSLSIINDAIDSTKKSINLNTMPNREIDSLNNIIKMLEDHKRVLNERTYRNNLDNALCVQAFMNIIYNIRDIDTFNEFLSDAPDFLYDYSPIITRKAYLEAIKNTQPGNPFVNFKCQTFEGKSISFSDFVGRGETAVVFFWSSWKKPCINDIEIINRIALKRNDLVVLGVPVWDNRIKSEKAIKDNNIHFTQLFVGKDLTPSRLYGIQDVPNTFIISGDGTILKRDLTGNEIENYLNTLK